MIVVPYDNCLGDAVRQSAIGISQYRYADLCKFFYLDKVSLIVGNQLRTMRFSNRCMNAIIDVSEADMPCYTKRPSQNFYVIGDRF